MSVEEAQAWQSHRSLEGSGFRTTRQAITRLRHSATTSQGFDWDLALQAEAFLQQIDPVVEQLRDELPQAGYDRRGLGQLIGQLMQFQEDALGVNVSANARRSLLKSRGLVFCVACRCKRGLLRLRPRHA